MFLLAMLSACTPSRGLLDLDASDTARGDLEMPPWLSEGDGTIPGGDMSCPSPQMPCNHEIRLGVSEDGLSWSVLEAPLATQASVANVVPMDYGVWHGEPWGGLWVTYVDFYHPNFPSDVEGLDNVLTVASIAFPWSAVQTADDLAEVLAGDGPEPWVFHRTDTWRQGPAIVDPEREIFDTPDGWLHILLAVSFSISGPPENDLPGLHVLGSRDGLHFEPQGRLVFEQGGTDPDCFPLGFEGAYPGVLPQEWAPGGTGSWGCHISGFNEFRPFEGDLERQTPAGAPVQGVTVTATTRRGNAWFATGHVNPASPAFPGQSDLTEVTLTPEGWSAPRPVLATGEVPGTEGGLQAPTHLELPTGVHLITFHSLIHLP